VREGKEGERRMSFLPMSDDSEETLENASPTGRTPKPKAMEKDKSA